MRMSEKSRIRIVVDEDPAIIARLDAIAERESLSRSDVVRRAIRRLVFSLPTGSTDGIIPEVETEPADIAA